ncbi:rhodanese-like domain-containing protein [Candidatus Azambacteria bacterium]|nr:rhodanese-like domain-containing protein [Candidatus Azambacteria bacterium]
MTNTNKIIAVGIVLIALVLGAHYFIPNSDISLNNTTPVIPPPLEASFLPLEAQSIEKGGVTITALPRIAEGADRWEFTVTLDTHTIELSQDFAATSVLRDEQGGTYAPLAWDGSPPGGHHREGALIFAPITPLPQTIILEIRDTVDGKMTAFEWVLRTAEKSFNTISSAELAGMLEKKDFFFVNVHIPYEGEIKNTDAFIPYDTIADNLDTLPKDKSAKIVLYCRSGRMSEIAAQELTRLGYTQVSHLSGGMLDWKKNGYEIYAR